MEALEKLRAAFPPPGGIPAAGWDAVEAELGLRLPASYKQLCDLYGDGPIGGFELMAPQAGNAEDRFPAVALAENASLRRHRDRERGEYVPIPDYRGWRLYPEETGLLPWAWDGALLIFFEVDQAIDPDRWRIVAPGLYGGGRRTPDLQALDDSDAAAFLTRALEDWPGSTGRPQTVSGRVGTVWDRIEALLGLDYWEAESTLRPGVGEEEVAAAEAELGARLPEPFRESLLRHDGQEAAGPWIVSGGMLNALDDLLHDRREWMAMQDAGELDDYVEDARPDPEIRGDQWWRRGWLPFVSRDGDHLVLDLDPSPKGQSGQVFAFSREDGPGRLAAPDFAAWLELLAEELETGIVVPAESPVDPDADEDDEDELFVETDEDRRIEDEELEEMERRASVSRTWPT